MQRNARKLPRLICLFGLGCLLFNFPLLSIFNLPVRIFGVPLLYVYLFVAWGLLIGLVAWVVEQAD